MYKYDLLTEIPMSDENLLKILIYYFNNKRFVYRNLNLKLLKLNANY